MKKVSISIRWLQYILINSIFNQLYNTFAGYYDSVAFIVSRGLWKQWIRTVLPFIEQQNVLEIGHGPGHLICHLVQNDFYVTGVDISRSMTRMAEKNIQHYLQKQNLNRANYRLVRTDAKTMPFSSGAYPIIVSTFPAPYIFQKQTLFEINRVLSREGKLIILLNAILDKNNILNRGINLVYRLFGLSGPSTFDAKNYLDVLQQAGFHNPELVIRRVENSNVYIMIGKKQKAIKIDQ